jgi:hypothetical protein
MGKLVKMEQRAQRDARASQALSVGAEGTAGNPFAQDMEQRLAVAERAALAEAAFGKNLLAKTAAGGGSRDIRSVPFAERLLMAYERVAYMEKAGTNEHFGYKFLGEAQVKQRVNAFMLDLGIYIKYVNTQVQTGATPRSCVVTVAITLADAYDSEGPHHVVLEGVGGGEDKGDKAPMKAAAAAWKYAFTMGMAIATGDDPESDPSTDARAEEPDFDVVLRKVLSAETVNELNLLKPSVAALKQHPDFQELKAAVKATKASLDGDARQD